MSRDGGVVVSETLAKVRVRSTQENGLLPQAQTQQYFHQPSHLIAQVIIDTTCYYTYIYIYKII
jgi:hypothetical protein